MGRCTQGVGASVAWGEDLVSVANVELAAGEGVSEETPVELSDKAMATMGAGTACILS
jgi:hypothetical protein